MKTVLYWLAAGLLLPVAAQAQLGLRVGSNVAGVHELWSRNAFSPSISPGLGYQAGVYYRVPLGPQWALVPELQFSRESQQVRREGFPYDVYYYQAGGYLVHDYRTSFSFLAVPVVVRRRIGPVYAELGPQVSFLLGGRSTGETRIIGSQVERAGIDQAATAHYNRVEAGICLGVGLRLPAGWGVSARAYQGLSSLTPDPKDYAYLPDVTPASGTQYRRVVQLSLTRDVFRAGAVVAAH